MQKSYRQPRRFVQISGMTKKNFIALADTIRAYNENAEWDDTKFTRHLQDVLAGFCASQNKAFNRQHWLDYIAGRLPPFYPLRKR